MAELRAKCYVQPDLKELCYTPKFLKPFLDAVSRLTHSDIKISLMSMKAIDKQALRNVNDCYMDPSPFMMDPLVQPPGGGVLGISSGVPLDDVQFSGEELVPPVALFPVFARVQERCQASADEIRRNIAAYNDGQAAPGPLPGLLCGSVARKMAVSQSDEPLRYFTAFVWVDPSHGTFTLFFDSHFKARIVLFVGAADIVETVYVQFVMGMAFAFDYPRICLGCKAFLPKARTLRCSRCRGIYCSRGCQERHWPLHKALCARPAASP